MKFWDKSLVAFSYNRKTRKIRFFILFKAMERNNAMVKLIQPQQQKCL